VEVPRAPSDLERAVQHIGLGGDGRLPRLPFTRREAEEIARLAPPSTVLKALDFDASRQTATAGTLGSFRIVHFATHALLNTAYPDLSGVVLSLVDERGAPQDGFLRLHDVYSLDLAADLVVLSACQTALGKDIRGEGLVGLTRGFMYAGARRVVTSLWNVDDEATAALMRLFYQRILGEERLTASAALRAAQIDLSRQRRWRSPYFWAGFVVQGDWK
jgi:CHAT domain-containing protein